MNRFRSGLVPLFALLAVVSCSSEPTDDLRGGATEIVSTPSQLFLEVPALGDVAGNPLHSNCLAVFQDQSRAHLQHHLAAVFRQDFQGTGCVRFVGKPACYHLANLFLVCWSHNLQHAHLSGLRSRISGNLLACPVERSEVALQIMSVDNVIGILHQLLIVMERSGGFVAQAISIRPSRATQPSRQLFDTRR